MFSFFFFSSSFWSWSLFLVLCCSILSHILTLCFLHPGQALHNCNSAPPPCQSPRRLFYPLQFFFFFFFVHFARSPSAKVTAFGHCSPSYLSTASRFYLSLFLLSLQRPRDSNRLSFLLLPLLLLLILPPLQSEHDLFVRAPPRLNCITVYIVSTTVFSPSVPCYPYNVNVNVDKRTSLPSPPLWPINLDHTDPLHYGVTQNRPLGR